jgi:hypothetical protein
MGSKRALMLTGNNQSDDLFMFVKKKITELEPNTEYTISFNVEFATNISAGAPGTIGSPGEGVFLKAGASDKEPVKNALNGYYTMNLDKGNQSTRGDNMIVIGTISSHYVYDTNYTVEARNNISAFTARSNHDGELWIIVGSESGFEGITTIYYTQISLVLSRSDR